MASSEEHNNIKDEMAAETAASTSDDNMLMMPDFLAESLTDSFNPAAVPSETTTATAAAAAAQPVQPDLSVVNDNIVNADDNVDGAALFGVQSMKTDEQPQQQLQHQQQLSTSNNNGECNNNEEVTDVEWANSLVGRWWEIFWEPNEEEEEEDDDNRGAIKQESGVANNNTEDVVMSIRGGGIDDDNNNSATNDKAKLNIVPSSNDVHRGQGQASSSVQQIHRERPRPSLHHQGSATKSKTTQQIRKRASVKQQQQQPYQHRPRFLDYNAKVQQSQQQPQQQPQQHQATRPQTSSINVIYNGPKLGLSLGTNPLKTQIHIKDVAPNAPNAHLLQVDDILVGINGKRFPKDSDGKIDFQLVVTALKNTVRPMTVNFERGLVVLSAGNANKSDRISGGVKVEDRTTEGNSKQLSTQPQQVGLERGGQQQQQQQSIIISTSSNASQHDSTTMVPSPRTNNVGDSSKHPKATPRELQFPLESATDFSQPGWTKRVIPRENVSSSDNNKKSSDTYYYSPVQGYKLRSRPEVRRFIEIMTMVGNDETIAIEEFRREKSKKRSEKSKATTTGGTMSMSSPTPMEGGDDEDVPLNRLSKDIGEKKRRQNSFEDDAIETEDETSTADTDSGEDEDTGEDAIDWYDGKILSYSDGNFVVYFLGDEEDVTYTMPLTPKIVRPSVRAWTKRTLALLSHDVDLIEEEDMHKNTIGDTLPPWTALPQDEINLAYISENADRSNYMRLIEYGKLLETQIQLAKQLSPHADDDQSGGVVNGEDEGPGPFANKSYVKHLCSCLEESKKVCDWLSNEDGALDVFKRFQRGTLGDGGYDSSAVAMSKDSMLSFFVKGATFLQRVLALIPNKIEETSIGEQPRNGRKRRRTYTNELSDEQTNDLPSRDVVSPDSLDKVMKLILDNYSGDETQQMLVASTLKHIVSVLYLDLWQPHQEWIHEAENMIYGKSNTFYSFEQIELHMQAARKLTLFDVSVWRMDLEAKLNRARFFEMEAWSAIKACTTLDESGDSSTASSDSCLLALNRLQNEISSSKLAEGEHAIMRNMNPLGKQSAQSLTRDSIENAIKVRQWILDLMQAKTVRERSSFVQSVIERYVTLPQLPTPPFSGFVEGNSDPITLLKENTKDSISALSTNCYSHTHIVGNIAAQLSCSMQNTAQDHSLRSKEGVTSALSELRQLPILTVVEEKIHARDKLIGWNDNALSFIESTTTEGKQQFQSLEKLHTELCDILNMTDCQNVRPNETVEREVKSFAAEDMRLICPKSGTWVQNQYSRGCRWRQNYLSIKSVLQPHGYNFGEISSSSVSASSASAVDVSRIKNLLADHDTLASCFNEECGHLKALEKVVNDWVTSVDQTLRNGSFHLEQRHGELVKVEASRPKGIITNPPQHVVDLWVRVLLWGMNLKKGVETVTEQLLSWKASQTSENQNQDAEEFQESVRLVNLHLGPIIIEGQDFMLLEGITLTPLLLQLRNIALASFSNKQCAGLISKREIIESSTHGDLLLSRVIGSEADSQAGFPLQFVRDIFWKIMACSLIKDVNNGGNVVLSDAKTLATLCVRDSDVSSSLTNLINNAEQLQKNASNAVDKCSTLLQTNCFLHQNDVRQSLQDLESIQTDFKSQKFVSAARLLQTKGVETLVATKLLGLTWLVDTFSHPILFDSGNGSLQSHSNDRISVDQLQLLYERSPVSVSSQHVGRNEFDREVVRVHNIVSDLHHRAEEWQRAVRSIIPLCHNGQGVTDIIKVETIEALTKSQVLSKVTFPELSAVENAASIALQLKNLLTNEFYNVEYHGVDVNKGRLPSRNSLIAASGDFLLYRFTGGEMYSAIEKALASLKEMSLRLSVTTEEKATVDWMVNVFDWVTSLRDAVTDQTAVDGPKNMQLVLKVDHALSILERGHAVFYSVPDEVQQQLSLYKVAINVLPRKVSVEMMKQGTFTLGLSLLRWAALLFDCLKADLDSQDRWKESALDTTETFQMFESNGLVSTFGKVTEFSEKVKELISVAENLVIQDDDLIQSLFLLPDKMSQSDVFQKQLEIERIAAEERRFALEKNRFEEPSNIVKERNDLLDSLLARLSSGDQNDDDEVALFVSDHAGARDKSRLALEDSLLKGMETLGMELNSETRDFVSNLAWELELAAFMKYCSHETLSNEYRDKVRSLRFNLMDPKNPMLCTRVVSGQLAIPDLVAMSSDALASKQLKQIRQQVEQEAIKNVVISPGTTESSASSGKRKSSGITSELAKKIRIESIKKSKSNKEKATSLTSPAENSGNHFPGAASFPPVQPQLPLTSTFNNSTVSELLAAIPPMMGKEQAVQPLMPPTSSNDLPPMMYPPPHDSSFDSSHSHGHHITSQYGSEEFTFTISRLNISFTSKIFIDQSCEFRMDGFLPSSLVEKGRLEIDAFNKFVHDKTRSGKSKLVVMKVSSISGGENTTSYKTFYKEYESLRRICMFQVSDTTKVFLVTPKFLRVCKCLNSLKDLSRSSSYVVVITKEDLPYQNN